MEENFSMKSVAVGRWMSVSCNLRAIVSQSFTGNVVAKSYSNLLRNPSSGCCNLLIFEDFKNVLEALEMGSGILN